ncbi:hypothetical protein [Bacillus sp. FSL M8-0168]|uniref:hypothetical protein n=1 Tax=Bacillus sp. FSL M8-0168 TaxID=2921614 RepID=UPI0030FD35ED
MNIKDKHVKTNRKISSDIFDTNNIDDIDAIKDSMTVSMISDIDEMKITDIINVKRNVDNIIIIAITAVTDIICAAKHIKWNL